MFVFGQLLVPFAGWDYLFGAFGVFYSFIDKIKKKKMAKRLKYLKHVRSRWKLIKLTPLLFHICIFLCGTPLVGSHLFDRHLWSVFLIYLNNVCITIIGYLPIQTTIRSILTSYTEKNWYCCCTFIISLLTIFYLMKYLCI